MGLTDEDIKDLTLAWNVTMGAVEEAMLARKGYTWSLMDGENNANASPLMLKGGGTTLVDQAECVVQLTEACSKTPRQEQFQTRSTLFGAIELHFSPRFNTAPLGLSAITVLCLSGHV
jgi:hypothetical protein